MMGLSVDDQWGDNVANHQTGFWNHSKVFLVNFNIPYQTNSFPKPVNCS